jgi:crossover junction endodeoxyribonuclease RuvC
MMILGIDPGLASVGWAVVENNKGIRLVECGCFVTEKETVFPRRLEIIFREIENLAKKFHLDVMAVEELYFAKNVKTAILVAQCLGVIKLAGGRLGLPVFEYTPLNVKMTITGYGRADKKQIEFMVKQTLKIKERIKPSHAADAAAVALTHCFTNKKLKLNLTG